MSADASITLVTLLTMTISLAFHGLNDLGCRAFMAYADQSSRERKTHKAFGGSSCLSELNNKVRGLYQVKVTWISGG